METLNKYDALVNATFTNIYTLTSKEKDIALNDFNVDNKNHLFFLMVCNMASNLMHDKKIKIKTNLFNWIYIKFKLRYHAIDVYKAKTKDEAKGINIDEVLTYMAPLAKELELPDNCWGNIYDEYYAVKKAERKEEKNGHWF